MAKTRGFPLKGDLNARTYLACWNAMSMRRKMEVRNLADGHDMTKIQVLNRWPHLRVEPVKR
ncbi:MAG TPA: hypothetical protein VFI41_12645 [Gemmatimonadales bacterium]|nr:hypothetical protein [Gemmatimonadales bacterium]